MNEITETPEYRLLDRMFGKKLNPYVEAVCVGKPLGLPEYDRDAEQWWVYFEESETPWSDEPRDMLEVTCEDAQEATDIYNYYNQNPVKEIIEDEDEEATS